MVQFTRINEQGLYVEPVILEDPAQITDDLIATPCPEGFYIPKWDGSVWVEGATQEYIDALRSVVPEPTLEERMIAMQADLALTQEVINSMLLQ